MNSPAIQRALMAVRHPYFAWVIGGVVACLAFLIMVSFAAVSWVGNESSSVTALSIWLGDNQGFGDVRFIDRFLILIPLAAITLIAVAVLIILQRLPIDQGLVSLAAVSLFLLIFPYLWKGISTNDWRKDLPKGVDISAFTDLYNTVPHTIFSFLAVVVSVAGMVLYFADQHGLLPTLAPNDRVSEPPPSDESE